MASTDPSRPNILFVLSDDQGAWAMGCAGNTELRTPNLDRLAAKGTRFSNFFCTSPVCSPARATIFTGKIPSQHGVHDFLQHNKSTVGDGQADDIDYVAGETLHTDLLAAAGYVCGLSGKWHLGVARRKRDCFSYWNVFALGGGPYFRSPMFRDAQPYRPEGYVSDVITDNALEFLTAQLDNTSPFCLHVHYTAPHSPWDASQHPSHLYGEYFANCPFESVPNPPLHADQLYKEGLQVARNDTERRAILAGYFAAVTGMDANIGRLVDWLEANELDRNTLVFFCSDNGMSMGHHGIYGKGNGTFPANMFDSTVKVPAIAVHAGRIPEGRVVDTLLSQYDLFPTLLDYAGIGHRDERLPGRSFLDVLEGGEGAGHDRVVVFDEYGPVRMIRTARWKYVHRYPFGPHELYDIADDPGEDRNMAADASHQDVARQLRFELERWFLDHVVPGRDGVYEAVAGRGQVGLAGIAAEGRERFPTDLVFERDRAGGQRDGKAPKA